MPQEKCQGRSLIFLAAQFVRMRTLEKVHKKDASENAPFSRRADLKIIS
jgi:hypothetical protein